LREESLNLRSNKIASWLNYIQKHEACVSDLLNELEQKQNNDMNKKSNDMINKCRNDKNLLSDLTKKVNKRFSDNPDYDKGVNNINSCKSIDEYKKIFGFIEICIIEEIIESIVSECPKLLKYNSEIRKIKFKAEITTAKSNLEEISNLNKEIASKENTIETKITEIFNLKPQVNFLRGLKKEFENTKSNFVTQCNSEKILYVSLDQFNEKIEKLENDYELIEYLSNI
jgi:hypothetical protein